jgi:ATP-dependent protease ClpP protease subunit
MPKRTTDFKFCFRQEAKGDGSSRHLLYVYDSVRKYGDFNWQTWKYDESETSAKFFRDRLDEIPDGEDIELHVNSAGGEVGEGVTIFNLLRQKQEKGTKITAYVDGMAYSVAMDIVMAAQEIHMGLGTTMFLHNPWMYCSGNAAQLRAYAEQLDAMGTASRQLYLSRSGGKIDEKTLQELMEKETMLDPQSCLKYGFCDVIDEFKADEDEDDDDKDEIIQELRNQLFRQQEMNRMMQAAGMKPAAPEPEDAAKKMRETLAKAMEAVKR